MHFRIYTKLGCSFCVRAKDLILDMGDTYVEESHDTPEKLMEFKAAGYATFPQIFAEQTHVGGHDDLVRWYDARGDNF